MNWDGFTYAVIQYLNTSTFTNFMGTLNPFGNEVATFDTLGPIMGTAGFTLCFAYALAPPDAWDFVSNPINVEILP